MHFPWCRSASPLGNDWCVLAPADHALATSLLCLPLLPCSGSSDKPQVLDLDHGKDKPFLGVTESHLPEPLRPKGDGRDFLNPVQSKREKIRHRLNVYRTEQNVIEQNITQWTLPSLWWKTLFKPRSRTILANSKLKDLATPSFLCFVHGPSGQRWVIPGALLGRWEFPGRNSKKCCLNLSMGKIWYIELMIILGKIPEVPFLSRDYWEPRRVHVGQGMPHSTDFPCRKGDQSMLWEKDHRHGILK